ncbi:MAG: putative lipid II flippase FtsW [Candidatus Chisholmbacteria bacterium]|nr:putative lipid II flippase FtsW [Candidatus Chisholmbacteria bacterium]
MKSSIDKVLLGSVLVLVAFGILMVYNASVVEAFSRFSDKFYFAKLQLRWVALGLVSLFITSYIPYQKLAKVSLPLFLISLFLLIVVLIPGVGVKVQGARRWLSFGPLTLQPAEIVKLTFVLYLASWLEKHQSFWPFMLLSGIVLGLVVLEPDLGTAVVITTTGFLVYFLSGAPLFALIILGLTGFLVSLILILSSGYRKARLLTFFNPTQDPLGTSYHIRQILIALGSGGLFGLGIGRSRQKYAYLPQATTDSIFAIIAEELGFLGAAAVIALVLLVMYRGFKIASHSPNRLGQLLAGGITSWLGLQAFINLASMVVIVPLTGVPFPFISYGGSSLFISLTAIGILLNISRFTKP